VPAGTSTVILSIVTLNKGVPSAIVYILFRMQHLIEILPYFKSNIYAITSRASA
jgi:hypothetical protein